MVCGQAIRRNHQTAAASNTVHVHRGRYISSIVTRLADSVATGRLDHGSTTIAPTPSGRSARSNTNPNGEPTRYSHDDRDVTNDRQVPHPRA